MTPPNGPRVLNVGAGGQTLTEWGRKGFQVVTLDIAPENNPDIVADMCNMGDIGEFEAVYSSHSLEHLYPHQVSQALSEFRRVLKVGGVVTIMVPDLEDVRPDGRVLGIAESGPISGLHLFYGDPRLIPIQPFMAHHCGFIADTLAEALKEAGFKDVMTQRLPGYNLLGAGIKRD